MINQSTEDYLKAMYMLGEEGGVVTTSRVARELGVSDGSVTGMLKKLSAQALIRYMPYRGMALTAKGRTVALRTVRRHRLWELFLVQCLHYDWHQVHEEAERLEHAVSEELVNRLDRFLGFPTVDPHGDPIPGNDGSIRAAAERALSEAATGVRLRIVRITDDRDILKYATELGLRINRTIVVRRILKLDGSMKIRVGSREHFISRTMASEVFVRDERRGSTGESP